MDKNKILNFTKPDSSYVEQLLFFLILLFTFSNCLHHFTAVINISLSLSGILFFYIIKKSAHKPKYNNPLLMPIFLFGLWALFGICFSPLGLIDNLHDFVAHYLKYVLFFFCIIQTINSTKRLNILLWGVVLTHAAYYAWIMVDFYIIIGKPLNIRLGTNYSEFVANIEGFLTITAMFFAIFLFKNTRKKSVKILLSFCIAEFIIVSILPQSRGSALALFVSICIYSCRNKAFFATIILIAILIFSFANIKRFSYDNFFNPGIRKDIFLFSIEVIKENPIIGMGFHIDVFEKIQKDTPDKYELYKERAGVKQNFSYRRPHSSLLSLMVRVGITGALLYLWIIFTSMKMAFKGVCSRKRYLSDMNLVIISAFSAFFIKSLFEPTFTHRVDTVFFLLLGIQSILWTMDNPEYTRSFKLKML